jgi:hypothetical protein
MATKTDTLAAKQRRQKIILAVGGLLLLGLLAFQGPKLLHRGSSSSSTAASPATTSSTGEAGPTTTTGTGATTGTSFVPATGGPTAKLAGVVIATSKKPAPAQGQLRSFSRFKAKNLFVPQVSDTTGTSVAAAGGTSASAPAAGTKPVTGTAVPSGPLSSGGGLIVPKSPAAVSAFAYATIIVNGKPQQLQLKQVFPKNQPTFVLRAVGKRFVTVGVAGGRFTDGSAVKLVLGKEVTLLNTATGQRFVIKLVYVGVQPEAIASFRGPTGASTSTGK